MPIKFNPLLLSGFQFDQAGSAYYNDPVATEADLPIPDTDGSMRVVLDTHDIYIYDVAEGYWENTGVKLRGSFGNSPNDEGISLDESQNVDGINERLLQLQPADATHPGAVSTAAQDFGGNKTFKNSLTVEGSTYANSIDARSATTMSIGTTNANVINIGNAGATVNIQGTTLYENVTQLQVSDPLITLNKGGAAGSAASSGVELEEDNVITAYMKTSADRNSWRFKAPNVSGEFLLSPNNNGFNNVLASSVLSATRTYTLPDISGTVILDAGTQTLTGNKTFTGTLTIPATVTGPAAQVLTVPTATSTLATLALAETLTNKTLDADLNTISNIDNNDIKAAAAIALNKLAATTASRVLVSDGSGFVSPSSVTTTTLGYLDATSSIQTQLNNKQPLDSTLTALAAYNTNGILTQTAADTFTGRTITAANSSVVITNGDGVSGNPTVGLDATLVALASHNTNGILTQTAADTFTGRTITALDSSVQITNGNGVSGNPTIGLDATLIALAGYNTNGILTQTAADTFTGRTITAGNGISVSNGNGVSGNPTITNSMFTSGDIALTSFSGANNQSAAANVTGLAFANGSIRGFNAVISVTVDATSDLFEVFNLTGIQRGADWSLSYNSEGDASGVVFSITNAGQVQYQSSNYAGFTSLTIKFRAEVTTV
jgi:hypothetical protein